MSENIQCVNVVVVVSVDVVVVVAASAAVVVVVVDAVDPIFFCLWRTKVFQLHSF